MSRENVPLVSIAPIDVPSLWSAYNAALGEMARLNTQLQAFTQRAAQLEAVSSSQTLRIASLQKQCAESKQRIESLQKQHIESSQQHAESFQQEIALVKQQAQEIDALKKQATVLTQKNVILSDINDGLRKSSRQNSESTTVLWDRLQNARMECTALTQQIEQLRIEQQREREHFTEQLRTAQPHQREHHHVLPLSEAERKILRLQLQLAVAEEEKRERENANDILMKMLVAFLGLPHNLDLEPRSADGGLLPLKAKKSVAASLLAWMQESIPTGADPEYRGGLNKDGGVIGGSSFSSLLSLNSNSSVGNSDGSSEHPSFFNPL